MPITETIEFKYTTIKTLRDEGIDATTLPDARAFEQICIQSEFINQATAQWFTPVDKVIRLDGNGASAIHLVELVPIIKVRSVAVLAQDTFSGVTEKRVLKLNEEYVVNGRFIKLIGGRTGARFKFGLNSEPYIFGFKGNREFPEGTQNIEVDGVFGWLEGQKEVETQIDGTILASTSPISKIKVDSVAGFRVKDVVDVIDSDTGSPTFGGSLFRFIINEIDSGPNELKFDSSELLVDLADDSKVITYGRVPRLIGVATVILINRSKEPLGSSASSSTSIQDRIIEERTDNYHYKLRDPEADELGNTRSPYSTGNAEVDRILAQFHAPPYIGVV